MDGWIFGNLIFGGIVGGVVDLARGAGRKFPPQIQIVMDPASFRTEAERDRHYDDRLKVENERWDRVLAAVRGQCDQNAAGDCERRSAEVEAKRRVDIERVESNRRSSRIGPG